MNYLEPYFPRIKGFKKYDDFAPDASPVELNFRGKSSHQTYMGAWCTIILYPFYILIFLYMVIFFEYATGDVVISSSVIQPFTAPSSAIFLNKSTDEFPNVNFKLFVSDNDYDNDDNPYGTWVYHMYTNMKDENDTSKDVEVDGYLDKKIPLVPCIIETEFDWSSGSVINYCPNFSEDDFFYGNWYSKRFAWSRLALH
jgi:hypothetical protein